MSIKASNNVFPHDPDDNFSRKLDRGGYAGTAQDLKNEINALEKPDGVLIRGEVVKTGNVLSIAPLAFTCRIDQVELTNIDEFETTIAAATDNYHRIDIGVFTKFGTIVKIQGTEGLDAAQKPDVPADTIEIFFTSVFGSVIGEPVTPPEITDLFVKKTERQKVIISENVSSFTLIDERHFVEFTNPAQGNFNYFVQSSTYVSGQNHPFRIRNNTGHAFTLSHLTPSGSSIPGETLLFFQNAENFGVKDKEIIEFVYDTDNNRYEYFGIITDLSVYYNKTETDDLLDLKLDASAYNDRFKGKFVTLIALQTAHPTANAGDYAQVDTGSGFDVINYNYDLEDGWIEGGSGSSATNTDMLPEGSTNLYWTTVRGLALVLTGLSAASGTFTSSDTLITAFGKIKYLIDNIASIYQAILTDVNFGAFINGLTGKTTPIDADSISIVDSADSNKQKKVSLTNLKAYLLTFFDTKYAIPQITITTSTSITTATTDGSGYGQKGRNVIIDNGTNAINLTVNGGTGFTSSYIKHGTGVITFVQGSGRTLIKVDGTLLFNGAVGSVAIISSVGTTDYLRIYNA